MATRCPRLVVAGTGGDSGKTLVAMGLLIAWRHQGFSPAPFKKGPDYIDASWLRWAAGATCRNLDSYLQPTERLIAAFANHASSDINVIEGNRGLHDGLDLEGTHSTASVAKLLRAPVVLVVNAAKVTRTVAAVVVGCQLMDPDLEISGVVLNRVAGSRHETMVRRAVETIAGVEVVGAIPRLKSQLLPDRHLGLVPPEEREGLEELESQLLLVAQEHINLDRLAVIAQRVPGLPVPAAQVGAPRGEGPRPRVGVFLDSAFTFYYPENLEALEAGGAELVRISGLGDTSLPDVDALYMGGGFPETHAVRLAENTTLHRELRRAARASMPIYAECGGMIYLARSLVVEGRRHAMAGVLPVDLELFKRPQGHGYVQLTVDQPNPFFSTGETLRGHEFHYTRIVSDLPPEISSAFTVDRGVGIGGGRDGLVMDNVLAAYTHLHALGTPEWATGLIQASDVTP